MKKMISILSMVLALSLLLGSLPFAVAKTETQEPLYGESFLLRVESETHKEYTLADFPSIEHVTQVYTVKKTPLETGFAYFLLVVLDQSDETLLAEAKQQAETYGEVYKNYLAEDYADCNSLAWLNYSSLELKVGETATLEASYMLADHKYGSEGVLFTVDPEIVDEAVLVESGYKNWGLSYIYGAKELNAEPWYENTALKGQLFGEKNGVSTLHSYFGREDNSYTDNLFEIANNIANQPGVTEIQLLFEPLVYTTDMPSARFSCSPDGIVDIGSRREQSCVITGLQPGETTVTVKVHGGGKGTATTTCKVTVVEDTSDVAFGDVNSDTKVDANDALLVLKFGVGKITEFPHQNQRAEAQRFPFEVDVVGDGKIDAADALHILRTAVGKGEIKTNLVPWEEFSFDRYVLEDNGRFSPMVIHDSTQLKPSLFPNGFVSDYKDFPFEQKSLIVFSDLMVSNGVPTVTQVAVNDGNVLVRYCYAQEGKANQYLVAVAVPKTYVAEATNVFTESLVGTKGVQPTAFLFEMSADNTPDFETQTAVMTNKQQVQDFLALMQEKQWSHPICERFLRFRANDDYFEDHVLVLTYENGIHGETQFRFPVKSIFSDGTTATVKLKTNPSLDGDIAPNARRTLLVRMVDLPNYRVEHCEQFVFQYAQ